MNERPAPFDTSVPHSARIWNYFLGGKDNYESDRMAADQFRKLYPGITDDARASRQFLIRSIRYLAGEAGVRQFLDIGTGLPTVNNTHEVAQHMAPECRVVYVDHDPMVLAHARALLTSTPEGATSYLDADLREPEKILEAAAETLDFSRPVALILSGILGHMADYDEARLIVRRLVEALPPGSYLAINDGSVVDEAAAEKAYDEYNSGDGIPYIPRTPEQIGAFFEGLDMVDPGLVNIVNWHPDAVDIGTPAEVGGVAGVGRKA